MQTICHIVEPYDQLLGKQKIRKNVSYRLISYVVKQPVDDGLLIYNTLTKAMLLLTQEEAALLDKTPDAMPRLIEEWFVVPEKHDDRLLSNQLRAVGRMLAKPVTGITDYTILTTTDCNARCFYCYELGRARIPMSHDMAQRWSDYILQHSKGQKVTLHWFGGEPLYNKPVITQICQNLKAAGMNFSSTMISNGYLFDDETIAEARDLWRLKSVQITLDGTEEIYNRSKAYIYKEVNAYRRVIENIHLLLKADIRVKIRLNVDMHNAENLLELADELHREFGEAKKLSVYLHTLFENNRREVALQRDENRKLVYEKMLEVKTRLQGYGLARIPRLRRKIKLNKCMADNDRTLVLLPTGHIGKCEHFSEDHFIGHIDDAMQDEAMKEAFKKSDEYEACDTCFDYPNCFRLTQCEDFVNCYPEERDDRMYVICQGMKQAYEQYKQKQQDEIQG